MKFWMLGYRCLACRAEFPWGKILYLCPGCGSNMEVVYDFAALRRRFRSRRWRGRDGDISRYREWLPLERDPRCPLPVGGTPLLRVPSLEKLFHHGPIYLKDDTRNPSASFKDRASWVVLNRAREEGARTVAAASTGNAGASLACLAASVGKPCVIFVPHTAPKPKLAQLQVFGARVLAVKGNYDAAFDLCAEACGAFGWYNRNTGMNPLTREGKKTVSFEIFERLDRRGADWIFVPTGDGNILSGVWKGFKDLLSVGWIDRLPKLVAVQAAGSNAIARAWREGKANRMRSNEIAVRKVSASTRADSISVDVPRDAIGALRALEESDGLAVEVSDREILDAQRLLARTCGVFAEPSGAAGVAGLRKLCRQGKLASSHRAVCLVTGNGLKDVKSVLDHLGEPPMVDPRLSAVRRAVAGLLR